MNMVCDSDETGCMDETACNFDATNVLRPTTSVSTLTRATIAMATA